MLGISKGVGKLITVLLSVAFVVHMVACGWYYIDDSNGMEPGCWVVRQDLLESTV